MPTFLQLSQLTKHFGPLKAVDGLSLALERGQILALLGPSGSGKTTTLRLLAGFESPDVGSIVVDGEDVTHTAPVARRFGMVFQHYALFPHLDVGENVAFGLESQGVAGADLARRVASALGLVDLEGFQRRKVTGLSGGQQQRVALARALAPEPRVLLLDEPLSNLDPTLRERTRRELRAVIHRVGITTVIVTHEQEEAFALGDRVALLRSGRVEQVGTADELYEMPATPFVAGFVGRATAIDATVVNKDGAGLWVRIEGAEWTGAEPRARNWVPQPGERAIVMFRPESLWLTAPGPGRIVATVTERRFTGSNALYTVRTDGGAILEVSGSPAAAQPGQRVGVAPSRRAGAGIHLFPVVEP